MDRPVLVTAVALDALGRATADEHCLRGAAALDHWHGAVGELAVGDSGHAPIIGGVFDSTLSRYDAVIVLGE